MTGEMRRIPLGAVTLNVLVAGEGRPVLLVHGFPDSHRLWRNQVPALVAAGFKVIAPDMRGFGLSDAPADEAAYRLPLLVGDLVALLDALEIPVCDLVGHDWGAVVCWHLCFEQPRRVRRYAALSVGHPTAYARAPLVQKLMGWYILFFQLRGLAEWLLSRDRFRLFGRLTGRPDELRHWIADLSRPGRFTAALNYYRANIGLILPQRLPAASQDVLGVWSSGDFALCEQQMVRSGDLVAGDFHYHRVDGADHWLPLAAPAVVNRLLIDHFAA
ncbi:alpha/beta fold hydrolase [Zavarzinia sp.]|uniref:alpha/beta fold hydrolase n=1 Tax=Zavarzinia sp. TaxID=2027920 RepID=UPI003562D054